MTSIIIGIIAFVLGTGGTLVLLRVFNKRARLEAEAEAELLKKNKLIEAKEKFIALKAEHEQQVMQRNAKVQEKEVKLQATLPSKKIVLNSFIMSINEPKDVKRYWNKSDAELETLHILFLEKQDCIDKMFKTILA